MPYWLNPFLDVVARSVAFAFCIACSNLGTAQESAPRIWLPVSHSESLRNDLDAVIAHANTRDACKTVLEAKLNDSSEIANAKFIITCESENYGTQNLVYWRNDVRNEFADVAYLSVEEAEHQRLNSQNTLPALTEHEKRMLVDHCKTALRESLEGQLPLIADSDIHFRQRGEDRFAIFLDYKTDSAVLRIANTATCLTDRSANIRLSVFRH